jgi:hypothetical protein
MGAAKKKKRKKKTRNYDGSRERLLVHTRLVGQTMLLVSSL